MSRCGVNRWGPGTTCERPINTEAAKELKDRLAAMAKEREKQDQMWDITNEEPVVKATVAKEEPKKAASYYSRTE